MLCAVGSQSEHAQKEDGVRRSRRLGDGGSAVGEQSGEPAPCRAARSGCLATHSDRILRWPCPRPIPCRLPWWTRIAINNRRSVIKPRTLLKPLPAVKTQLQDCVRFILPSRLRNGSGSGGRAASSTAYRDGGCRFLRRCAAGLPGCRDVPVGVVAERLHTAAAAGG